MTRQRRAQLLTDLGSALNAPVLAFVTGDRPGVPTQVAAEQLVYFPRHLRTLGKQKTLAVLLYTRGGETYAVWPIVSFIREFCDELIILIPFYAHSAGTLMTLGGNKILMSRLATLSPVDPTVANQFNPQDPAAPQNRIPIAVEDVTAFFELSKRMGASSKDDLSFAFRRLSESVHPLALGNVQRSIDQIRQLAQKLIRLHSPGRSSAELDELVRQLTTGFYSHFHLISRREAREMKLPVEDPSPQVEDLLMSYYDELTADLKLLEKFEPGALLAAAASPAPAPATAPQPGTTLAAPAPTPAAPALAIALERAYIETATTGDTYTTRGLISMRPQAVGPLPPGMALPLLPTLEVTSEGWERTQ